MDFAMAGIHHEPFEIRLHNELLEQRLPNALVTPAAKTPMGVFPSTIRGRQVSPRRAGAKNPEHGIDELAVVLSNPTPNPRSPRQMGLEQFPVPV